MCRKDERKEVKEHDEYAVGTFIQESSKLVGHVPIELSFLAFTFLRAHEDNQVVVEGTESRKLENGLVIPGTFKAPSQVCLSRDANDFRSKLRDCSFLERLSYSARL